MKREKARFINRKKEYTREVFTMKRVVAGILVMVLCLGLTATGFAQGPWGQQRPQGVQQDRQRKRIEALVVFGTLPAEERAELLELRQTDPEQFKKAVAERIRERGKELHQIKQDDPQQFEEIKQKAVAAVKNYIQDVKEDIAVATRFKQAVGRAIGKQKLHNHIVFETLPTKKKEKIVALREKYQKALKTALEERTKELEAIKKEDPEKFKEIIQGAMKSARERMAQGKRRRPEAFEPFGKMKPEYLKEKLEWLKNEDPELYQYLIKRGSTEHRDSR